MNNSKINYRNSKKEFYSWEERNKAIQLRKKALKEKLEKLEKEKQWWAKTEEFEGDIALMGSGTVDKTVEETAIALSLLGFGWRYSSDYTSSGGSLAYGVGSFIVVSAPGQPLGAYGQPKKIGEEKVVRRIAEKYGITVKWFNGQYPKKVAEDLKRWEVFEKAQLEIQKEFSKLKEALVYKKWREKNKKLKEKLLRFIKEFYVGRKKPANDIMLKVRIEEDGSLNLHNGSKEDEFQYNNYLDMKSKLSKEQITARKKRMLECRIEMQNFGRFLKNKFFNQR